MPMFDPCQDSRPASCCKKNARTFSTCVPRERQVADMATGHAPGGSGHAQLWKAPFWQTAGSSFSSRLGWRRVMAREPRPAQPMFALGSEDLGLLQIAKPDVGMLASARYANQNASAGHFLLCSASEMRHGCMAASMKTCRICLCVGASRSDMPSSPACLQNGIPIVPLNARTYATVGMNGKVATCQAGRSYLLDEPTWIVCMFLPFVPGPRLGAAVAEPPSKTERLYIWPFVEVRDFRSPLFCWLDNAA